MKTRFSKYENSNTMFILSILFLSFGILNIIQHFLRPTKELVSYGFFMGNIAVVVTGLLGAETSMRLRNLEARTRRIEDSSRIAEP